MTTNKTLFDYCISSHPNILNQNAAIETTIFLKKQVASSQNDGILVYGTTA